MRDFSEHFITLEKINAKYTEGQRMWKLIEEMGELIAAIARYAQETDEIKQELQKTMAVGELADVHVMLHHIARKFDVVEAVDEMIHHKIYRQKQREGV